MMIGKAIRWFLCLDKEDIKGLYFLLLTATPKGSKRLHTKVIGAYKTEVEARKMGEFAMGWFPRMRAIHFGQYPSYRIEFVEIGIAPSPYLWEFVFDMEGGGNSFGE